MLQFSKSRPLRSMALSDRRPLAFHASGVEALTSSAPAIDSDVVSASAQLGLSECHEFLVAFGNHVVADCWLGSLQWVGRVATGNSPGALTPELATHAAPPQLSSSERSHLPFFGPKDELGIYDCAACLERRLRFHTSHTGNTEPPLLCRYWNSEPGTYAFPESLSDVPGRCLKHQNLSLRLTKRINH